MCDALYVLALRTAHYAPRLEDTWISSLTQSVTLTSLLQRVLLGPAELQDVMCNDDIITALYNTDTGQLNNSVSSNELDFFPIRIKQKALIVFMPQFP